MKNNQKGFANVVLIGVLVILIGIGGYFVLKEKQSPVVQQVPITSAGEIANWKTYTNTQYGFEFKYPETYSYNETTNNNWFPNSFEINMYDSNHAGFSLFINQPASGGGDCDAVKRSIVNINGINMEKADAYGFLSYSFKSGKNEFIFATLNFYESLVLVDQILSTFKFTK